VYNGRKSNIVDTFTGCCAGKKGEDEMRRGITILLVSALLLVGQGLVGQPWPSQAAAFVTLGSNGWSDPAVGDWDPVTMTGTLRTDLAQGIQITAGGIVLDGAGHTLTGDGSSAGVYVNKQNNVTVKNIHVQGFAYGIYLYSAQGNTVADSTANGNTTHGIYLNNSRNNTLTNNSASGNLCDGLHLEWSSSNTLTGNSASNNQQHGFYLSSAGSNVLAGNTMAGNVCDFRVDSSWEGDYIQGIDTSNRIGAGGKAIYYLVGATGVTIDAASNAGAVYLVNCSDVTLKDLVLSGSHTSVLLWNTHNSQVENVQATGNAVGIWLRYSNGNTLTNNTVGETGYAGIYLEASSNNTLRGNWLRGNRPFGLLMSEANENLVYHNRFVGNATQASVTGTGNAFSWPKPEGGNYWDNWTSPDNDGDGIVDLPYTFDFSQIDEYPWVTPDGWETLPPPVTPTPQPTIGAAFITGGGWINPPAATTPGKAHVEVQCRVAKGAQIPTGHVNLNLNGNKLRFQSTAFEWMVIDNGQAWVRGWGTAKNGDVYRFIVALVDGQAGAADKLRIKVWDEASGSVYYDSQPGADDWATAEMELGGGNVTIHKD